MRRDYRYKYPLRYRSFQRVKQLRETTRPISLNDLEAASFEGRVPIETEGFRGIDWQARLESRSLKGTKNRGRSKVVKDWLPTSKFPNTVSLILARARARLWNAIRNEQRSGNEASERIIRAVPASCYYTNVPRFPIGRWPSADSGRPGVARGLRLPITSLQAVLLFPLLISCRERSYLPSAKPSMVTCVRAFDSTGAVETASQLCANNAAFVLVYARAYIPLWNMHVMPESGGP